MKKVALLFLFSVVIASTSCNKAGTGGAASLALFPEHHGLTIKGATAYIKFDTKEAPASLSDYDLTATATGNHPDHIHFENLKPGNYYLYCVGYDSAISMPVRGGIPYTIERADKSKAVDIKVPVTE